MILAVFCISLKPFVAKVKVVQLLAKVPSYIFCCSIANNGCSSYISKIF